MSYADVADLNLYWRQLTDDESVVAERLLEDASSKIRNKAKRRKINFDELVANDSDLFAVTKSIVCKCVMNAMKMTDSIPATQFSESAGGYVVSGTYYVPGGGLSISKADWKELGLGGQLYGGLDV